jgi:hypothetical protein
VAFEPKRLVLGLVGVQLADAAFNAIPNQWIKDDLDHLRFPEDLRFVFPVIKSGSAVGLLLGLRWRSVGKVTAAALVAYFMAAMGFHARARDPLLKYVPAAGMLGWSLLALYAYRVEPAQPGVPRPGEEPERLPELRETPGWRAPTGEAVGADSGGR